MRVCPECHKLSRDDDFCSHCGAAVYPDNNFTGGDIDCGSYREFDGGSHSHEKQTYTSPYPAGRPAAGSPPVEGGRKNKGSGCVVWIILLFILFGIIDSLGEDFWEWLGELLEQLAEI